MVHIGNTDVPKFHRFHGTLKPELEMFFVTAAQRDFPDQRKSKVKLFILSNMTFPLWGQPLHGEQQSDLQRLYQLQN